MKPTTLEHGPLSVVASTLLGLFYPPACVGCGASLEAGGVLCPACAQKVERIREPFCAVCSEPFSGEIDGPFACPNCRHRRFAFECAVSAYRGRGLVRELIARFKYRNQHFLRQLLAQWLADALADDRIRCRPATALVPVPLHARRRRERGFNQAQVLAHALSNLSDLPLWPALRRTRYTPTQTRFNRTQRMRNLRGAFEMSARWPVTGAHLLLVDDVFTTGSTFDECARVLRRAGAAGVRVITVARR